MNIITYTPLISTKSLLRKINSLRYEAPVALMRSDYPIKEHPTTFRRLSQILGEGNNVLAYSDYADPEPHPLSDYQFGSVRDDFDFGPLLIIRLEALKEWASTEHYITLHSGFYSLILWLRDKGEFVRIPETLYTATRKDAEGQRSQFSYVDGRYHKLQQERQFVYMRYLRKHHLNIRPSWLEDVAQERDLFSPVTASVIIPVKNRVRTIADAVNSALSQVTKCAMNVIVVDNFSTDGTSEILAEIAGSNPKLKVIQPLYQGAGIGGCWQEAISSEHCGTYAIQLDSDDVYKHTGVVQLIVDTFLKTRAAMVVGAYELTNFEGEPIPPGLIAHKEWTRLHGHDNLLRVNGVGAPRAFYVPILRSLAIPDVCYGEDYALALRISRQWKVARIFESLYLCRRWEGNSDANLTARQEARNNTYKDWLRTQELRARETMLEKKKSYYGAR